MLRFPLALLRGVVVAAALAAFAARAGDLAVTPLADLRVRQEILAGVYHFAPDPDRDWLRVRARAGARLDLDAHRFEVRLGNEHRHYLDPDDVEFDWDELYLDHTYWSWADADRVRVTLGRQDLVWLGGLLVFDGTPLDGSRSQYVDALRCEMFSPRGSVEFAIIHNEKRDPLVLAGDVDRPLTDADETALAFLVRQAPWAWTAVYKYERDPDQILPDLATFTFGGRREGEMGEEGRWHVEAAVQWQDGAVASAYTDRDPGPTGYALAGEGALSVPVGDWRAEASGFYYSGQSADLRPFRTPWGRWPKWSELYIYTLIGESPPGRAPVAAWENIAAPRLACSRPIGERLSARLAASYLLAPATAWEGRGLLTQAELKFTLGHGLDGHLLWEMLVPGAYHDGRHDLPPLTDTVHFLRWQLAWSL